MFSKETEDKFRHLVSIYPRKRSALIPMLLLAQKEQGYITNEAVDYVAKYLIMICTNLSCLLRGSDDIEACVKRKLGINLGEVTPDGWFSAIEFECLASCTTAPVMQLK